MPKVTLNGADLYYEINGVGMPIVFTHGHSMNHKQWEPQVKALSSHYQVITWDVRGHGYSSLPPGKVNPRDFSRDLHSLIDYLQLKKVILCGLSMGGHISLQAAIYYPEKMKGLILIGTPYTNRFNWFEKYAVPVSLISLRLLPYKWTADITASVMSNVNPENKRYVQSSFNQMTKSNFLRHWTGTMKMESGDKLQHISCPTLILHGDKDKMVARQQQTLKRSIPHSIFKTITNANHLTNRDNPKAVTKEIVTFVNAIKLES